MTIKYSASLVLVLSSLAQASPAIQCWGNNAEGQTTVPSDIKLTALPVKPVEVRTARGATCALDTTGKITCWGVPITGLDKLQALTGVKTFSISPGGSCALAGTAVQCFSAEGDSTFEAVPTLKNPKILALGLSFACAQDAVGIHCWGGDSEATSVPTLKNPKKFQVTNGTVCALDDNGIECWGDGTFSIETVPALNAPTDFFLGLGFACAFDKHGFQCWGNPQSQNDGEGGAFNLPPIPTVLNPSIKTHYVAGQKHVCGLDATGVHCWGDNSLGQLDVPPLSHPTQIFADSLSNQTCALDDSGLLCWGEDQAGQSSLSSVSSLSAGIGNTCAAVHGKLECWGNGSKTVGTPIPVSDAYQVSVGSNFACAADVSTNSTFSCWGDNNFLQAGGPPLPTIDYTAGNQLLITSTLFTSGYNHACFYSNQTNGVSCFGNNDFGQSKPPITFISNGGASVLSAGGNHTCGIDALQGLLCWGENEYGESTPPKTLKNPRQVSSGFYHTCALDDNGVSCWGRSSEGETTVPKLVNPRYVQSGGYHTCALDDNGVTCWGENSFGQSTVPSNLVMLGQGRKITALSSGQFHTCAVTQ